MPQEQCRILAELHYLRDDEFNGMPLLTIARALETTWPVLQVVIISLVENGEAQILWEEFCINPHINRLGFPSREQQVDYLREVDEPSLHACLYPSEKSLRDAVAEKNYLGRPYSLEMAYGAAQLDFRSFDLHVLEAYRNDPRYSYDCSDIGGTICVRTAASGEYEIAESDQIFLQTFGFSYDQNKTRAVAVFLRYLSSLSPEHQQIWKARENSGVFQLHPDYYRSSVNGEWPEYISLFEAFSREIWLVNEMTKAIYNRPLFIKDFGQYGEERPKKFAFLLRPTLEEFNDFALLLDKMLSDNISLPFFKDFIELTEEIEHPGGRFEIKKKGSIRLLDEFIRKNYRTTNWGPVDICIANMKQIRRLRQKPAHAINENCFDIAFLNKQREVAENGYDAVCILRCLFQRHPKVVAKNIEVESCLAEGKIWTM